ncbi:MAG: hypothetical protein PV344_07975, partial [Anaplasma sp.]|nr:hypothetical protein [Anaplasma sp.]
KRDQAFLSLLEGCKLFVMLNVWLVIRESSGLANQFLDLVEHKTVDVVEAVASKPALGKQFKKEAKAVAEALEALTLEQLDALEKQLTSQGYDVVSVVSIGHLTGEAI